MKFLIILLVLLLTGCEAQSVVNISQLSEDARLAFNYDKLTEGKSLEECLSSDELTDVKNGISKVQDFAEQIKNNVEINEVLNGVRNAGENVQGRIDKFKDNEFENTLTYGYMLNEFDVVNWNMHYGVSGNDSTNLTQIETKDGRTEFTSISIDGYVKGYFDGDVYQTDLFGKSTVVNDVNNGKFGAIYNLYNIMNCTHKWQYKGTLDLSTENGGFQGDIFNYQDIDIVFIWSGTELTAIYTKDIKTDKTFIYKMI